MGTCMHAHTLKNIEVSEKYTWLLCLQCQKLWLAITAIERVSAEDDENGSEGTDPLKVTSQAAQAHSHARCRNANKCKDICSEIQTRRLHKHVYTTSTAMIPLTYFCISGSDTHTHTHTRTERQRERQREREN